MFESSGFYEFFDGISLFSISLSIGFSNSYLFDCNFYTFFNFDLSHLLFFTPLRLLKFYSTKIDEKKKYIYKFIYIIF